MNKNNILKKAFKFLSKKIRSLLSIISPTLNSRILYLIARGEKLNLESPVSFTEKLMWLKLNTYKDNELVTLCADKLKVREYVKDKGLSHLLNDLYYVYDSEKEIKWDELPNQFVIKGNHGSGYNIICENKMKLDEAKTKKEIRTWLKEDYWKLAAELNYKNIEKKIICEKYLEPDNGRTLDDYKIYCFNGKPKAILYISTRNNETIGMFFDVKWNFLGFSKKYNVNEDQKLPEAPKSLNEMVLAAKILSKEFPFVRADFYSYNDQSVFGELTFTPAACLKPSEIRVNGKSMGELLNLAKKS